jgi:hypothetical protein
VKLIVQLSYTNKCLFFKNGEQEVKTGPVWGLAPVGEERMREKM